VNVQGPCPSAAYFENKLTPLAAFFLTLVILVPGGVAAFIAYARLFVRRHRGRVDRRSISHWLNANVEWRIIGS
jgi:hypothetical protein